MAILKKVKSPNKLKVINVYILCLILPSIILAYLGFQTIKSRSILVREMIEKDAIRSSVMLINDIESKILGIESDIAMDLTMRNYSYEPLKALRDGMMNIKGRNIPIGSIYFFGPDYHLLYTIDSHQIKQDLNKDGGLNEFQDLLLTRLRFNLKKIDPMESKLYRLSEAVDGYTFQIAYTALPDREKGINIGFLAFTLDMDYIRDKIIRWYLTDFYEKNRLKIVLLDDHNNPVYPDLGIPGSTYTHTVSFNKLFHFWRIGIIQDDKAVRSMAWKDTMVYMGFISIITGIILVGIFLTLRGVKREWELTKMKSEFVSNVSHELRTPLSLIRMFAETLMLNRVRDKGKRKEYYHIIYRESKWLERLIGNLLDFSRIEAGKEGYKFRMNNLSRVVNRILGSYRFHIEEGGFKFEEDIEKDLPDTEFDEEAISLVVLNLLDNAIKYSLEERFIRLKLYHRDGDILLEVEDHGIGIDRGQQKRIFENFYRVSDPRVMNIRGSGLGLSLAKHIVEAHGGKITVDSQVGKGSMFTIHLPLIRQERVA